MKQWQDNAGIDALVLLFLESKKFGATFAQICAHLRVEPGVADREVDRSLQRLRKKSSIRYVNRAWELAPRAAS